MSDFHREFNIGNGITVLIARTDDSLSFSIATPYRHVDACVDINTAQGIGDAIAEAIRDAKIALRQARNG